MTGNIARNMPKVEYQAIKALNASGAHTIERQCPAKYWHTSPYNPNREPPETANHFDIGQATHLLLLEPDKFDAETHIIEAGSYRTDRAKAARARAYNAGQTPLLTKEVELVEAMAAAILADPIARSFRGAGDTEVTMTWTDPEFGFACKLRVDHLPHDLIDLRDVKSAGTANPRDFEREAWRFGYPQRAAWYLDGVEIVTGTRPRFYWFIAVEKEAPFLVSVMKYPEEDIEWGRVLNLRARAMFAECLERDQWPTYRPPGARHPRAFEIRIPPWGVRELQDRLERNEIPPPRSRAELDVRQRLAARLQAPTNRDYLPPLPANGEDLL
jgi:hypothetical protein